MARRRKPGGRLHAPTSVDEFLARAEAHGFLVWRGTRHWRLKHRQTGYTTTVATRVGDWRGLRNGVTQIRRETGIDLRTDPPETLD